MKMYTLDGKELGTLVASGPSSKGEMMYLVEGKETWIVGTSKTMATVRTVQDHYREELVKIERATGHMHVLRLTWDGPDAQAQIAKPSSPKVDG